MFELQTRLIYGLGSTEQIPDLIEGRGWSKILIMIDGSLANGIGPWSEFLESALDARFDIYEYHLDTREEPTYELLDEAADYARGLSGLDAVIGIGGGSALDTAKATAALINNSGSSISYRGFDKLEKSAVPSICIPTTAGTGSEVTINAVFTDVREGKKLGINGRHMSAMYAVLDANWTASCPRSVALSSGLDALVHATESFSTWKATDITRQFSSNATALILQNLEPALTVNSDEARQKLLLGSYLAGIALYNSGSGISGALSYPLGVGFHVPHGIAGGITLPSVLRFNLDRGWFGYGPLLDAAFGAGSGSDEKKSILYCEQVEEFYEAIAVPKTFSAWGVGQQELESLLPVIHDLQPAFDQNPVHFSAVTDAPLLLQRHVADSG